MPNHPRPTTRPLKILQGDPSAPSSLAAGADGSLSAEDVRARTILGKAFGNLSTEALIVPVNFTGWVFYNDNPAVIGDAAIGLYLAGTEVFKINQDAFGDYNITVDSILVNLNNFNNISGNTISAVTVSGSSLGAFGSLTLGNTPNQGDILYDSGGLGGFSRLTPGTSGQFLKTQGAGANPTWADVTAGAPTDADYLVGTANGSLSNEIAVGTTPGGELGGTWASPTVDDLHASSYHPLGKIKTNAENVSNSTSLQNDDELTITVVSGVRYQLDAFIRWSDGGTGGIKWDFTGTSAISYQWTDVDTASAVSTDYLTATATVTVATTGNAHGVHITGGITTSGTTFTFRWACNAGGDTTTVEANSWIRLTRVA